MIDAEAVLELTPTQQGILFHCRLTQDKSHYVVQATVELDGRADVGALVDGVSLVTRRHSMLRTTFHWEGLSRPVQIVHRDAQPQWAEVDLSRKAGGRAQFLAADRVRGFDLSTAPPCRWIFVRLPRDRTLVVFTHHHLLLDGQSLELVLRDLADAYAGREFFTPTTFDQHLRWLRERDSSGIESFWNDMLSGVDLPTEIPIGIKEGDPHAEWGQAVLELPPSLVTGLREAAKTAAVPMSAVFHCAWSVLLTRYAQCRDVVFGVVFGGRSPELDGSNEMVGVLMNTLPLRVSVSEEAPFVSWMSSVHRHVERVRGRQDDSLAEVRSGLPGEAELFHSVVIHESYPVARPQRWAGLSVLSRDVLERPHYPLTLVLRPDTPYTVLLRYDGQRFTRAVAERIIGHLRTLLTSIAADPTRIVGDLEILPAAESTLLTETWNDTGAPENGGVPLPEMISVHDTPAIIHGDRTVTGTELAAAAARLAGELAARGVAFGDVVGIHLPPSPELLTAILAVWRLGAAYLPLDVRQPEQRLAFMVSDSDARAVVTTDPAAEWLSELITVTPTTIRPDVDPAPARPVDAQSTAYVIYTSGSTGTPKGVVISHGALANYISWAARTYDAARGSVLHSSFGFDLTVTSLFAPLVAGGPLIIVDSTDDLAALLTTRSGLGFVKLTPSHLEMLAHLAGSAEVARAAAVWVLGGEALTGDHLRAWVAAAPDHRFVNEYGPTEATVGCCTHTLQGTVATGPIPIGRPISNTRLYVFDDRGRLAPVGVPGELRIGGTGVADGYLGRSDLTADSFVSDPFVSGGALYRTGDLACYDERGVLHYLGRMDEQLKLRGHRIEPAEIEHALQAAGLATVAKVMLRKGRLVAYVAGGRADDHRRRLRDHLPEYMVPDVVHRMERLPLTRNGKVDATALPEPRFEERRADPREPVTTTERMVADAYASVLDVGDVGRADDFFSLGGHSLAGARVLSQLAARSGVSVPIRALFELRSVKEVAAWIDQACKDRKPAAAVPITAQRRRVRG